MGVDLEEDLKRKMVELNLVAARAAQSPQTGYVHLNYESHDRHDTMPILENLSFTLSLFRSRISDNVIEGKMLLEKLLVFEVDGNFPVYLHEYPQCKDRDFSLSLLPVFHWLVTDFQLPLGETLTLRLESLIGRILSHNYKMHAQRPLCKLAEHRLKSYFEPSQAPAWIPADPHEWLEALITWQMTLTHENDRLQQALEHWHPQLCTWIGPQQQDRSEPKVTLMDLFMGHYYDSYSQRALKDQRTHLLAGLIQPFSEKSLPLQKQIPCYAAAADSQQPYTLYWGDAKHLHSFCLDPKGGVSTYQEKGDVHEFVVKLPSKAHVTSQDTLEIGCFFNLVSDQEILINGVKATTFQVGDQIDLRSEALDLRLEILLEEGEGKFFGHILRANRPSQKGKNIKYEAYDWQIALRTICRSEECSLRVKITL